MKIFLILILITLWCAPISAYANNHYLTQSSYQRPITRIIGYEPCGCPIYVQWIIVGYDYYRRPIYAWKRLPTIHRCGRKW